MLKSKFFWEAVVSIVVSVLFLVVAIIGCVNEQYVIATLAYELSWVICLKFNIDLMIDRKNLSLKEPKTIEDYHVLAMNLSENAIIARQQGNKEEELRYNEESLKYEKYAAYKVGKYLEPSRSILFRGASRIAVSLYRFDEAIKLAKDGLDNEGIPKEIKEELNEVIKLAEEAKSFGVNEK